MKNHAAKNDSQQAAAAAADGRREFLADLRATFGHEAGRRVLRLLHAAARTDRPVFLPGRGGVYDTHAAAFRDGRRSILLDVEKWLAELDEPEAKPPAAVR